MIKTEFYMKRSDNVILVKTYSTGKFYIKQLETDKPIEEEETI